jgi:hypothetical protein
MELTARGFLNSRMIAYGLKVSTMDERHEYNLTDLLEEYHQAKLEELKKQGLIKLKKEIDSDFFDND